MILYSVSYLQFFFSEQVDYFFVFVMNLLVVKISSYLYLSQKDLYTNKTKKNIYITLRLELLHNVSNIIQLCEQKILQYYLF